MRAPAWNDGSLGTAALQRLKRLERAVSRGFAAVVCTIGTDTVQDEDVPLGAVDKRLAAERIAEGYGRNLTLDFLEIGRPSAGPVPVATQGDQNASDAAPGLVHRVKVIVSARPPGEEWAKEPREHTPLHLLELKPADLLDPLQLLR